MDADGSDVQRLTTFAERGDARPSVSPGGTRIAFERWVETPDGGGNATIWVANIDGSGATPLADYGENPEWSPDGRYVTLIRRVGAQGVVFRLTVDGRQEQAITPESLAVLSAAWSPDGGRLALSAMGDRRADIYIIDVSSGHVSKITSAAQGTYYQVPDWSPDGSRIAVTRKFCPCDEADLITIRPDGSEPTVVLHQVFGLVEVAWSGDGHRLAYAAAPSLDGFFDIFSVNADGSGNVNLTNTPDAHELNPSWGP